MRAETGARPCSQEVASCLRNSGGKGEALISAPSPGQSTTCRPLIRKTGLEHMRARQQERIASETPEETAAICARSNKCSVFIRVSSQSEHYFVAKVQLKSTCCMRLSISWTAPAHQKCSPTSISLLSPSYVFSSLPLATSLHLYNTFASFEVCTKQP